MKDSLKTKKILLVSSQTSHRSGIRKSLCDVGADNALIEVAADFSQAQEKLAVQSFHILITEDEIGPHNQGIDLLALHEKNMPSTRDRIFLLMTSNPSPFVIADFTLKGGDILLNKPFTRDTFIKAIEKTLKEKSNVTLEEGLLFNIQDALRENNITLAKQKLEEFPNPEDSLACQARALIAEFEDDIELAYENLQKVVAEKIQFKALAALIRTGTSTRKFKELLKFVEIWLQDYPIHHESLPDITKVIIVNSHYKLLDRLYNVFTQYKVEDHFAKLPLAAGFVMASTHHFNHGNRELTRFYALKGIDYSSGKFEILSRAMDVLVRSGFKEEAEKAYLETPFEIKEVKDQIEDLKLKEIIYPKDKLLKDCFRLLSKKVVDPDLYDLSIKCMREAGKDPEELLYQARRLFPQRNFD